MARVLLIKPTSSGPDESCVQACFEPLGLMYLSAFLKKYSEHVVCVVDAQAQAPTPYALGDGRFRSGMRPEEIAEQIRNFNPDVVGVSCLFENFEDDAIIIARAAKSVSSGIKVVAGGMDASVRYKDYLHSGAIDLVVEGQGEETFLDIVNAVAGDERVSSIAGTYVTDGAGNIRRNEPRTFQIPFDEYPFPDREALPRSYYHTRSNQAVSYPFSRDFPATLIQSSRGCRMKCVFCQIVSVCSQWYAHSAQYVVEEMEECIRKYGTREFIFLDDNFMLNPKRVVAICELIVERKLQVSLDILPGISVWTISEPIIDLMVKAGVYRVCLPIESGNPRTLKFINKPIDLDKARHMIDYCTRKGLFTYANLIIGFPYESEDDIKVTVDWANRSGLDAINYYVAEPLSGSRMFHIYEENGWLSPPRLSDAGKRSPQAGTSWRTQYFTYQELAEIAQNASSNYLMKRALSLLKPKNFFRYFLPKISSPRKIRYTLKLGFYIALSGKKLGSGNRVLDIFGPFLKKKATLEGGRVS